MGELTWYGEQSKPPVNPAVEAVVNGPVMGGILQGIAREGRQMWRSRTRWRTGQLANSTTISLEMRKNAGSLRPRRVAELTADTDYAAAVEFGRWNLAKTFRRPAVRERVKPGQYPPRNSRYARHTMGGDNRRVRSIVADLERLYGGRK
ncbi:hypothetical protein AWN90_36635 [Nocardia terpenica]|uniref:Uncharacterized protein n=2 Tax=Nocardia terpenica TaxID=455432 RepID=A0A164LB06_9NOCA|nr:hypothetical protein AWN90_36635 [Nocardia terpenica]